MTATIDWLRYAERVVAEQYGDVVSAFYAGAQTHKFGRVTVATANTLTEVTQLQGTEVTETLATSNSVDSIVSSSAADIGKTMTISGWYYDGSNNFVAHTQTAALLGQTPVGLSQPLCRATRGFVTNGTFASPATAIAGVVSVYDSAAAGGTTAGVPNTAAATKLRIEGPTYQQSQKCAVASGGDQYLFIGGMIAAIERAGGSAVSGDVFIQRREQGGVWREIGLRATVVTGGQPTAEIEVRPFSIIPPNTDLRGVTLVSSNTQPINCHLHIIRARVLQ